VFSSEILFVKFCFLNGDWRESVVFSLMNSTKTVYEFSTFQG